jgi:hypothetical protein
VPGLVRVHLLNPSDLVRPRGPAWFSWLGLSEPASTEVGIQAVIEMYMDHKETEFQKLLSMTIRFKRGSDHCPDRLRWQHYCDRLFCELRGYLMGKH